MKLSGDLTNPAQFIQGGGGNIILNIWTKHWANWEISSRSYTAFMKPMQGQYTAYITPTYSLYNYNAYTRPILAQ